MARTLNRTVLAGGVVYPAGTAEADVKADVPEKFWDGQADTSADDPEPETDPEPEVEVEPEPEVESSPEVEADAKSEGEGRSRSRKRKG